MNWPQAGTSLLLLVVIGASLYVGVGGMERVQLVRLAKEAADKPASAGGVETVNGSFINKESAMVAEIEKKVERLFPWIGILTSFAAIALTSAAFGTLGGAARVVKELAIDSKPLEIKNVVLGPLLGATVGIMLLGISYIIPTALTTGQEIQPSPAALLFICFFGGLFSTRVYGWVESIVERIFPKTDTPGAE